MLWNEFENVPHPRRTILQWYVSTEDIFLFQIFYYFIFFITVLIFFGFHVLICTSFSRFKCLRALPSQSKPAGGMQRYAMAINEFYVLTTSQCTHQLFYFCLLHAQGYAHAA